MSPSLPLPLSRMIAAQIDTIKNQISFYFSLRGNHVPFNWYLTTQTEPKPNGHNNSVWIRSPTGKYDAKMVSFDGIRAIAMYPSCSGEAGTETSVMMMLGLVKEGEVDSIDRSIVHLATIVSPGQSIGYLFFSIIFNHFISFRLCPSAKAKPCGYI